MVNAQHRLVDPLAAPERRRLMELIHKLVEANDGESRAPMLSNGRNGGS